MRNKKKFQLIGSFLALIMLLCSVNSTAWAYPADEKLSISPKTIESDYDATAAFAIEQLHLKAVELNLFKYTGLEIDINAIEANKEQLDIHDETLYQGFIERLEAANRLAKGGYVYFDKNYVPQVVSLEKIQQLSSEETAQSTLTKIKPFADIFDLTGLVRRNRTEVNNTFLDFIEVYKYLPNGGVNALVASAVWFKGKVQSGGPWDYKVQPGWGGASKIWQADTYTGVRYITTEYLGNYNYSFAGAVLFPLNILLVGGQYANGNIWVPEAYNDRLAIQDGFRDSRSNP